MAAQEQVARADRSGGEHECVAVTRTRRRPGRVASNPATRAGRPLTVRIRSTSQSATIRSRPSTPPGPTEAPCRAWTACGRRRSRCCSSRSRGSRGCWRSRVHLELIRREPRVPRALHIARPGGVEDLLRLPCDAVNCSMWATLAVSSPRSRPASLPFRSFQRSSTGCGGGSRPRCSRSWSRRRSCPGAR